MESKLLKDFLAEQVKLINVPSHARPADKTIVRPDTKAIPEKDTEATYNYILEKKPNGKKVVKFIQQCINDIMEMEDE
jgi:hypothetical protein